MSRYCTLSAKPLRTGARIFDTVPSQQNLEEQGPVSSILCPLNKTLKNRGPYLRYCALSLGKEKVNFFFSLASRARSSVVEQLPLKQLVVGSNPTGPSILHTIIYIIVRAQSVSDDTVRNGKTNVFGKTAPAPVSSILCALARKRKSKLFLFTRFVRP